MTIGTVNREREVGCGARRRRGEVGSEVVSDAKRGGGGGGGQSHDGRGVSTQYRSEHCPSIIFNGLVFFAQSGAIYYHHQIVVKDVSKYMMRSDSLGGTPRRCQSPRGRIV